MNTFACVLLLAAVVAAEPPRYRLARFRSERQEISEGAEEGPKAREEEAPYAAAGFQPTREFKLPSRQEVSPPATSYGTPDDSYGAPFKTYATPQVEYGVPENKEEHSEGKQREEKEGRRGGEAEKLNEGKEGKERKAKHERLEEEPKQEAEIVSAEGAYYVLLPGSQLQRVQFQTENDIRNMAYTARLQYRSEDRAPLFVYTAAPQYQSAAYVQLI